MLNHPTRERWQPGAGGMCLHSIQVAPDGTLYIAISAAGAFRSDDGGKSFTPINKEVAADFMPDDPYPEVGQCVHKLLVHPAQPERLWQQNHCGVYRSDDRGDNWERLDGNGLPSDFGFGIALDPADPDAAWVIPEEGAANRVTSGGRLGVYRTRDGGASWELDAAGLPERGVDGRAARGDLVRHVRRLLRHPERLGLHPRPPRRRLGGGGEPAPADPLGRVRLVVVVLLPSQLENEAGGRRRFEVEAETARAALHELPVADLLFDERGTLRPLVRVYIDGEDARDGLDAPLAADATIRLIAAIAGG